MHSHEHHSVIVAAAEPQAEELVHLLLQKKNILQRVYNCQKEKATKSKSQGKSQSRSVSRISSMRADPVKSPPPSRARFHQLFRVFVTLRRMKVPDQL